MKPGGDSFSEAIAGDIQLVARIELARDLEQIRERLHERLRRQPCEHSVAESAPILFFGDPFLARVATVGLNPSPQEFLDPSGDELSGALRRFETLGSLGANDRPALSAAQCDRAIETMRGYFDQGRPVYKWFRGLSRVVEGMGYDFAHRNVAHLDLVQEATTPAWSRLPPDERKKLLEADLPFLEWEIAAFQLDVVVCTSKTVGVHLRSRFGVEIEQTGDIARIRWWAGHAEVNDRNVAFCGWNYPLARPTGLGAAGEVALGQLLARQLRA